jgi:hypothetical protein
MALKDSSRGNDGGDGMEVIALVGVVIFLVVMIAFGLASL